MLKFIGCGSAFNTELGNNGAFIKEDNTLFMIDCGSNTFDRLIKSNVLEDVKYIYVLMTHTHPDHVGSLGDLIFYSYFRMGEMLKVNLTVLAPEELGIKNILESMGVEKELYKLTTVKDGLTNIISGKFDIVVNPVPVTHVKELSCFGYIIFYKDKVAYYSGDSNEIPENILRELHSDAFDVFYQDTSKLDYPENNHLSLRKLTELVDTEFRDIVFCMHLDPSFDKDEARSLGFNVVSTII
jgi:ribonuclease BN (tRNA processing enzyme)